MDMNHFPTDFHIAQQSRRDKLRIQNDNNPNSSHHSSGLYYNNLEHLPCYEMPVFCSEMLAYPDPTKRVDPTPFHNFDTVSSDPPYFSTWKSIGSQTTIDWAANPVPNQNYQNALQELGVPGTQALSLSLSSSLPSPRAHQTFHPRDNYTKPELSISGRVQTLSHRNPGPLGPFTGYATILTSSKFLRPAQQLLEELCCMVRPKEVEIVDSTSLEQLLRVSSDTLGNVEPSFALNDGIRPENIQKKAKLMYMQDEVCKRYKQYHQQMQMVVSSFESVAGLSAATPYISLALNMVSKNFHCLKNTITDQLKSLKNSLGDELSSPSAGTSSSKGEAGVSMLKFFDQNFQKQKGAATNLGILENQHIWRPQRGLPERAVSVLRAWLFDHFLHPYPTDTDKHMLATQTGLTRNQVSNWFINARVRVWKPMVEEIHMLETKGAGADQTESTCGRTTLEGCDHQTNDQSSSNRHKMSSLPEKQASINPSEHEYELGRSNTTMWNQEKRSRLEYHIPSNIDGSLMGYVSSGIEMGGLGSVSLTLGLRQGAENGQRQRGQIIRDFVG